MWNTAGYGWDDAVGKIRAAVKAEQERYGQDHGLRGVFAQQLGPVVVVGQLRGEMIELGADLFGGLAASVRLTESASLDASALGEGLGLDWLQVVDGLLKETTVSGFAVPAAMPVRFVNYEHEGVHAARFEMPPELDFGPDGQMPVTHHLVGVALGVDSYLADRNVLKGAW